MLAATELQAIWRCRCGYWLPRGVVVVDAAPNCIYCCTRCPPGQCTNHWHRRHFAKPTRPKRLARPQPVRLWEGYR